MGLLEGKTVMVTGGAQGQGRAHAVESARAGADVILFDIARQLPTVEHPMATEETLQETVKLIERLGRRALAIVGDVRSQASLDDAVDRGIGEFSKIDVLVANAGVWSLGRFWELPEEAWDELVDINLSGVWKSAKAVAPHMIERRRGSMVLTSSINGAEPGVGYAHYVAAKHGVVGLMKAIALELAPFGIRCNAVLPGAIDTPMANYQGAWDLLTGRAGGTQEEARKGAAHFHALRGSTWLPAETVAQATLFLNSDLAASITGVALPVDAGHLLLPGYNHEPVP